MARTLNGTGTTYLGAGKPYPDGWRSATLWFVVFGMPILPLRRVILRPVGETSEFTGETLHFEFLSSGWVWPLEVLATYAVYWGLVLPAALGPIVGMIIVAASHRELVKDLPKGIAYTLIFGSLIWLVVLIFIVGAKTKGKLLAKPWAEAADSSRRTS